MRPFDGLIISYRCIKIPDSGKKTGNPQQVSLGDWPPHFPRGIISNCLLIIKLIIVYIPDMIIRAHFVCICLNIFQINFTVPVFFWRKTHSRFEPWSFFMGQFTQLPRSQSPVFKDDIINNVLNFFGDRFCLDKDFPIPKTFPYLARYRTISPPSKSPSKAGLPVTANASRWAK